MFFSTRLCTQEKCKTKIHITEFQQLYSVMSKEIKKFKTKKTKKVCV